MLYSIHDRERIPLQSGSILFHLAAAAANHLNLFVEGYVVAGVVAAAAAAAVVDVVVMAVVAADVAGWGVVAAAAAAEPREVSTHEQWTKVPDFQTPSTNSCP